MNNKNFFGIVSQIFTRENITLALSIFGAVGTLITWICSVYRNRVKLSFSSAGYINISNSLIIQAQIVNNSRLPLAISSISITLDGKNYICSPISEVVFKKENHTGIRVTDSETYYSFRFPINLPALNGESGYLFFPFEPSDSPTIPEQTILTIYANRGRKIKIELKLSQQLFSII